MERSRKIFEKSVKPFFYKLDTCYITYAPNNNPSDKNSLIKLSPAEVRKKFDFQLLCDDLKKSAKENIDCFEYNLKSVFSDNIDVAQSYSIKANNLDSFILHKFSEKTGFGILSATNIERGSIIAEYVGARTNGPVSDSTYLFLTINNRLDIDAKDYGNAARFFNHCPATHPNKDVLTANVQAMGCSEGKLTKIFFVALRDIKAFEPICWDYLDAYDFKNGQELINAKTYLPIGRVDNLENEL